MDILPEKWNISICGLNCAKCDLYLIPENEHSAQEVLEWFKNQGWIDKNTSLKEFMAKGRECEGCRGPIEKNWSSNCFFRPCALNNGYNYCFECEKFPCEHLTEFANDGVKHHQQTVENLKIMKKIGIKKFIETQSSPCFCPNLNLDV